MLEYCEKLIEEIHKMKKFLSVALIVLSSLSFAGEDKKGVSAPTFSKEALNTTKATPNKAPPLGNCDENTDYKIYKCEVFKCKMPIVSVGDVKRTMEVVGMDKGLCIFNYKLEIRHAQFQPSDFRFACKLSSNGALEMANQFTEYKKGNIEIYNNPPYSEILNKECAVLLK